ncbi:MAG: DUF5518 domain-containing protein [Methanomicrobiales archaeon]|nr:DUF5518 domain-containing protein [Methanomicrobiales archaeon]
MRGPHQFILPGSEYREVSMSKQDFWLAAIVGAIVMFLLSFLPVLGPLIGGFVAGLIARGNPWNGAKAGFAAGIIGAILAAFILFLGASILGGIFHHALAGLLIGAGLAVVIVVIGLYHALLGLVGGAIGAAIVGK